MKRPKTSPEKVPDVNNPSDPPRDRTYSLIPHPARNADLLAILDEVDPAIADKLRTDLGIPTNQNRVLENIGATFSDAETVDCSNPESPGDELGVPSRARARERGRGRYPETIGSSVTGAEKEVLAGTMDDAPFWLCDEITQSRRDQSELFFNISCQARDFALQKAAGSLSKRIKLCCESLFVLKQKSGLKKHVAEVLRCDSRFCPACAVSITLERAHVAASMTASAASAGRLIHAVFTVPNCRTGELKTTCQKLTKAFRRFRTGGGGGKKPLAPAHRITGGIWRLEISRNHNNGTWHPHIHALIESDLLPRGHSSTEWFWHQLSMSYAWAVAATKEGFTGNYWNVHLSPVDPRDNESAVLEVSKYVLKPLEPGDNHPKVWRELLLSTKGMRAADSWGTLSLPPKQDRNKKSDHEMRGGVGKFLAKHQETLPAHEVRTDIITNPTKARVALCSLSPLDLVPDIAKNHQ